MINPIVLAVATRFLHLWHFITDLIRWLIGKYCDWTIVPGSKLSTKALKALLHPPTGTPSPFFLFCWLDWNWSITVSEMVRQLSITNRYSNETKGNYLFHNVYAKHISDYVATIDALNNLNTINMVVCLKRIFSRCQVIPVNQFFWKVFLPLLEANLAAAACLTHLRIQAKKEIYTERSYVLSSVARRWLVKRCNVWGVYFFIKLLKPLAIYSETIHKVLIVLPWRFVKLFRFRNKL